QAAGVDVHLAFTVPKEGANGSFDAWLIPADAPHPLAAHKFLNYILEPRVIAAVTNYIHYGNDNRAADAYVDPQILNDPAVYPPPQVEARLYETTAHAHLDPHQDQPVGRPRVSDRRAAFPARGAGRCAS